MGEGLPFVTIDDTDLVWMPTRRAEEAMALGYEPFQTIDCIEAALVVGVPCGVPLLEGDPIQLFGRPACGKPPVVTDEERWRRIDNLTTGLQRELNDAIRAGLTVEPPDWEDNQIYLEAAGDDERRRLARFVVRRAQLSRPIG